MWTRRVEHFSLVYTVPSVLQYHRKCARTVVHMVDCPKLADVQYCGVVHRCIWKFYYFYICVMYWYNLILRVCDFEWTSCTNMPYTCTVHVLYYVIYHTMYVINSSVLWIECHLLHLDESNFDLGWSRASDITDYKIWIKQPEKNINVTSRSKLVYSTVQ